MSLIYNGTTLTGVTYNGVSLTSVIYNGVEVWTSQFIATLGLWCGAKSPSHNYVVRIDGNGAIVGTESTLGQTGDYEIPDFNCRIDSMARIAKLIAVGYSSSYTVMSVTSSGTLSSEVAWSPTFDLVSSISYDSYAFNMGCSRTGVDTHNLEKRKLGSNLAVLNTYTSVAVGNLLSTYACSTRAGANNIIWFGNTSAESQYAMYISNKIFVCDASGNTVSSAITLGTSKTARSAAEAGTSGEYGVFYGGHADGWTTVYNTVTRANSSGAIYGSETSIGTARSFTQGASGASVSSNAMMHGGYGTTSGSYKNTTTRINSSGALVGSETAIGTAVSYSRGTSL